MNLYNPNTIEILQRLKKGESVDHADLLECMYDLMEDQNDLLDTYRKLHKRQSFLISLFPILVLAGVLFSVLLANWLRAL